MEKTYNVYFDTETVSNDKGQKESYQYCKDYIDMNNGTKNSYFSDYKGGTVSIYCNETQEVVYSETIRQFSFSGKRLG